MTLTTTILQIMTHPLFLTFGQTTEKDFPIVLVVGREPNNNSISDKTVGQYDFIKYSKCAFWNIAFKVLGASHEFDFSLVDRVLSFYFNPIYLPYRSIDPNASSGYVIYSIKPKSDAPLQTIIHNHSEIYFDFNPPVITNTTIHTLATDFIIVSVEPADPDNMTVNIYPNPGTDYLIIQSDRMSMEKDLVIYDAYGCKVISQKLNGKFCRVELNAAFKTGRTSTVSFPKKKAETALRIPISANVNVGTTDITKNVMAIIKIPSPAEK